MLHNSLTNIGILSAFMCALAGQIYTSPPPKPLRCYGQAYVDAMITIEWVAMGCFFISMIQTVILAADIDGVPDTLLVRHLRGNTTLHSMPHLVTHMGLILLAIGTDFHYYYSYSTMFALN